MDIEQNIAEMRRRLAELGQCCARKKRAESQRKALKAAEEELQARERSLLKALSKENGDVERLERSSAASLLYSLLGKREERLDKERREACAAKLKYDGVVKELADCWARRAALEEECQALSGCEARYESCFEALRAALRESPEGGDVLLALEGELEEAAAQHRELKEALQAGKAAHEKLREVEASLDDAGGWGTWDLLGGGLISGIAKHSHLDEAQEGAEELQLLLARFQTELADVRLEGELEGISVDAFTRFADYFFDGLIADWAVLSHINESQERVERLGEQLEEAIQRLERAYAASERWMAALDRRIQDLVRG